MRAFLLALVLTVGVAATAWAAIPDGTGAIRGCYAAGAPGAKGPAGPKGAKGESGTPSVAYAAVGGGVLDDSGVLVGELDLPAGNYLLLGTAAASNGNADASDVSCVAGSLAGGILPDVTETVPAGGSSTFTAQFAVDLPAATTVSVSCVDPDATDMVGLSMALTALPVGSIVRQ